MKFKSSDIPQADSLLVIERTVAAIASGPKSDVEVARYLGYTARQGHYYRKAAELCGYAVHINGLSHVTELGKKLVDSNSEKTRIAVLQKGVMNIPVMAALIGEFSHNKALLNDRRQIMIWLSHHSDLSESTVTRRSSTVLNYLRTARLSISC